MENFCKSVEAIEQTVMEQLSDIIKVSTLANVSWETEQYITDLKDHVAKETLRARNAQLSLLTSEQSKKLEGQLKHDTKAVIGKADKTMWSQLRDIMSQAEQHIGLLVPHELQGFSASEQEVQRIISELKQHAVHIFSKQLEDAAAELGPKMKNRFEQKFKYNGPTLRVWKPKDDILKVFREARAEGLKLLDLFFLNRLKNEEYDDVHLTIPSADDMHEATLKYPKLKTVDPSDVSNLHQKQSKAFIAETVVGKRNLSHYYEETGPQVDADDIIIEVVECRTLYSYFTAQVNSLVSDAQRQQVFEFFCHLLGIGIFCINTLVDVLIIGHFRL